MANYTVKTNRSSPGCARIDEIYVKTADVRQTLIISRKWSLSWIIFEADKIDLQNHNTDIDFNVSPYKITDHQFEYEAPIIEIVASDKKLEADIRDFLNLENKEDGDAQPFLEKRGYERSGFQTLAEKGHHLLEGEHRNYNSEE